MWHDAVNANKHEKATKRRMCLQSKCAIRGFSVWRVVLCGVSRARAGTKNETSQARSLRVIGLVLKSPCALYCPAIGVHIRYSHIENVSAFRGSVTCYSLECNLVSIKDSIYVQKPIRGCSHRKISKLKYWFPCGNKY